MIHPRYTRLLLSAVCLAFLAGCAAPEKRTPGDPLEPFNRAMFKFNDAVDRAVIKPVAKGYAKTPKPFRKGVNNFFSNLSAPVTIINNFLQGKFKKAFSDTGRFLMNSTIGLFGIFDPASRVGLARHREDFGQTLGAWGVPSGPYLVIPFLGPSTVRDGIAGFADRRVDPLIQHIDTPERYYAIALKAVDIRADFLDAEGA
ncbi:MAG: VacJ family lipoprotein, partial [Gammaproteobacteria bacterium]|nr:VacJ family lipoprotein [Gammaproteobacteria bacterium]